MIEAGGERTGLERFIPVRRASALQARCPYPTPGRVTLASAQRRQRERFGLDMERRVARSTAPS